MVLGDCLDIVGHRARGVRATIDEARERGDAVRRLERQAG